MIKTAREHPAYHPNRVRCVTWAISREVCFGLTLFIIKLLSSHISSITLLFTQLLFGILFFSPFIIRTGFRNLKTQYLCLHILRSILICVATFCSYYAYSHLSLSLATAIGFSNPLFTVVLFAVLFKSRITSWQWVALIGGYVGVLIIVQPEVVAFNDAIGVAFLGNIVASFGIILSKNLFKTESALKMMTYTSGISLILIWVVFLKLGQWPKRVDLPLLGIGGVLGILSQFCYLQALRYGQPTLVAPFEYTRLVLMVPLGYFFFMEIPNTSVLLGSTIIIISTYILTASKNKCGTPLS